MDDRNVLDPGEKAEMRGLVLAGAARADSIRRRRSRVAASVPAVLVVVGIAVGAGFASGLLGQGNGGRVVPAPAPAVSASSDADDYSAVAAYDRPRTAEDALPETMTHDAMQSILPETSRYIGMHDRVAYWITQGHESRSICIVFQHLDRPGWQTACGGLSPWGYWLKTSAPGLAEAQIGPAGTAPDGWIELDENLSVNPNP